MPVLLLLVSLAAGFIQPAYCESQPRSVFLSYVKALYYASSVKQVSKYWIKNARVPWDECLGTAAKVKLAELKRGYVYNAKIDTELLDGNTCTMEDPVLHLAGRGTWALLMVRGYFQIWTFSYLLKIFDHTGCRFAHFFSH
jgi:hypothetical protein